MDVCVGTSVCVQIPEHNEARMQNLHHYMLLNSHEFPYHA